ncbi:hypothetical protein [Profundibacter sp.]|uniref:hypothetical protein n=1 Tax=Profundibacter sp. TaxID=3101071 RepID=UPI003D0B3F8B
MSADVVGDFPWYSPALLGNSGTRVPSAAAMRGVMIYMGFLGHPHTALDKRTPNEAYFDSNELKKTA